MDKKDQVIQVRVTPKQYKKAARIAKRKGVYISELFRRWLEIAR